MADVFISYKRDEVDIVRKIAEALRDLALDVWFDANLESGESFNQEIDRETRGAGAILVCWSPGAIRSDWVLAESLIGFNHKKLAAVFVSGPPDLIPPTPFNATHAADLRSWNGDRAHAGWRAVVDRLGKLVGRHGLTAYLDLALHPRSGELRLAALRDWLARFADDPLSEKAWGEVAALATDPDEKQTALAKAAGVARERERRKLSASKPHARVDAAAQAKAWAAMGSKPTAGDLQRFADRWGNGPFVDLARARLKEHSPLGSRGRPWVLASIAVAVLLAIGGGYVYRDEIIQSFSRTAEATPVRDSPAPAVQQSSATAAWTTIDKSSSTELRKFISENPKAAEARSAETSLAQADEAAWREADLTATREAYSAYLAGFPANATPPGIHAERASQKISELEVARQVATARLRSALSKLGYSVGGSVSEVDGALRTSAIEFAGRSGVTLSGATPIPIADMAHLSDLAEQESARRVNAAAALAERERVAAANSAREAEHKVWSETARLNTEQGYNFYLSRYPYGEYAQQAQQAINAINAQRANDSVTTLGISMQWRQTTGGARELRVVSVDQSSAFVRDLFASDVITQINYRALNYGDSVAALMADSCRQGGRVAFTVKRGAAIYNTTSHGCRVN